MPKTTHSAKVEALLKTNPAEALRVALGKPKEYKKKASATGQNDNFNKRKKSKAKKTSVRR